MFSHSLCCFLRDFLVLDWIAFLPKMDTPTGSLIPGIKLSKGSGSAHIGLVDMIIEPTSMVVSSKCMHGAEPGGEDPIVTSPVLDPKPCPYY